MPEIQTIVLKVGMHCEGCARKVKKALCSLPGLEELRVDYAGQKATVKGALDANQVLSTLSKIGKPGEVVQVSVEPKKPTEEKKEAAPKEPVPPPQPKTIVLRAMLHCEGCGRKVKDAIKKVSGVQEITVNYKENKVTVKGFMDPNKVLQKALKTGKHVELLPPEKPKDTPKEGKGAGAEEKKDAAKGEDKKEASKGNGKDSSKEVKQESKDDKKNEGNKVPPKEDKKNGNGGPNKNGKNGNKEAPKDAPKEEKKGTPKKENGKEEKKDAPIEDKEKQKEDKSSTSKDEKKKEESKDEKKAPPKDEKNEEPRVVFPEYASPYMVYKCDACQIFSEDNPNACTIM